MFDAFFGEPEVRVGKDRDVFDGADAVDVWDDALHGQIPVLVHQRLRTDGEDGDMPGFHRWRWSVGGKELEVESIEAVDGDHAFAVVVEVRHQRFTERVEFASVWRRVVAREEMRLLFQGEHQMGKLGDDGFVGVEVRVGGGENETEIEDEFITRVR